MPNAFSVDSFVSIRPRVVASLQPWAEISQRLRRIFKLNQYPTKCELKEQR
jgi:hypothetical protein